MMNARLRDALADLTVPVGPKCGDKVTLLAAVGNVSRGSIGAVLGSYADNGDLVVAFDGGSRRIPAVDVAAVTGIHAVPKAATT